MAEQIHITIGNSENPKDEDTDCNLETQPTDTEKDDANANLVTIKQVPNLPDTGKRASHSVLQCALNNR